MYIPVFGKTVTFSNLPGIAVAVCAIVSFYKSRVNRLADRRCLYRSLYIRFAAKYNSQFNLNYPAFPACLVNSGIFQVFRRNYTRAFRTAWFASRRRHNLFAISLQNSLFIRFILIRCNQIHNAAIGSLLKIIHKLLNVFGGAFARNNADYQTIFGVISYMVPVISLLTVSRVCVIALLFLLANKSPFFIKLNFPCLRGKKLPTHREVPWRVYQQGLNSALRCFYSRQPDGRFCVLHSFRKYGSAMIRPFPRQAAYGTAGYLFVRKIASCMFGSIAAGYVYFFRICRIPLNYLHRVFHNLGTFYSDNKILKEPALSCLLKFNCLWDKHLSLIQDIGKDKLNCSIRLRH